MTFEARTATAMPAHAHGPGPSSRDARASEPTPTALRMQILTTEHWSLLASRGLAWNESFSRAGMYLSLLSGALVALGLVGGVDRFGSTFLAFALLVLPVVLFVGIATFLRMAAVNHHDALAVVGMNRIRAAYLELAPDLRPYFVMGVHDDRAGVEVTMATPPGTPRLLHVIAATPFVINVLNSLVAGAIAALLVAVVTGSGTWLCGLLAAATFAVALAAQLRIVAGNMRRGRASIRPLFPTPTGQG